MRKLLLYPSSPYSLIQSTMWLQLVTESKNIVGYLPVLQKLATVWKNKKIRNIDSWMLLCFRGFTLIVLCWRISLQAQKSWQCRQPIMMIPRQTMCGYSTVLLAKFQRVLGPSSEWTVTQGSSLSKQTVWRARHHSTLSPSLLRMLKVILDQCKEAVFLIIWFFL